MHHINSPHITTIKNLSTIIKGLSIIINPNLLTMVNHHRNIQIKISTIIIQIKILIIIIQQNNLTKLDYQKNN